MNLFKKPGKLLGDVINVSAAISTPVGLSAFFIPDRSTKLQKDIAEKNQALAEKLEKDPVLKQAFANAADPRLKQQMQMQIKQPPPLPPNSLAHQKEIRFK